MPFPKRSRRRLALAFALPALLFAGFFLWARSSTLPPSAYATVTVYDEAPAAAPETLTVMTYNLGYLSGMTNNRPVARTERLFADNLAAAERLLASVRPDVAAFQEIDFGAARSFDVDQLDALARSGGFHAAARAVNWDKRYVPFPSLRPSMHFGRIRSGQAVLSRLPILAHERLVLERPPTPFYYDAFYLDRLAQVVRLDAGEPIVVINVHLEAFDAATRNRQAERILALYRQYKDAYPVLLLGDFNSVLPEDRVRLPEELRTELEDDHAVEILRAEDGLREAFDGLAAPERTPGAVGTFPSDTPRLKIDHIFFDADRIRPVEAYVVAGPDQPSDHRAVVMRFVLVR
ncbi:endonuclease/exonuclease/phosphatase family protein [Rhodocaloribacter sp.]